MQPIHDEGFFLTLWCLDSSLATRGLVLRTLFAAAMSDAISSISPTPPLLSIISSLRFLNRHLASLPPLHVSTTSPFHYTVETIYKELGRLQDLSATLLAPSPTAEDAEDDVPEELQVPVPAHEELEGEESNVSVDTHGTRRARAALEHIGKAPLRPEDLIKFLLQSPVKTGDPHSRAEDAALARLFVGFSPPPDWDALLKSHFPRPPISAESHCQRSITMDALSILEHRIARRHKHLSRLDEDDQRYFWVQAVITQIESLKFALDWNSQKHKAAFYRSMFVFSHPSAAKLRDATTQEILAACKGPYAAQYTQWKRKNEPLVTARNRLLRMYLLFGAPVLLDPVWSVSRHRSRDFPAVLNHVCKSIPISIDEDGSPSAALTLKPAHERSLDALRSLATFFAGPMLANMINDLITLHPPVFEDVCL